MPYANIKELLVDATKYPVAIEGALPAGAPKISTMLLDAAGKIPAVPDFPMTLPDLPAAPTLPTMPAPPAGATAARAYVRGVQITPVGAPAGHPAAPAPVAGKPVRFLF